MHYFENGTDLLPAQPARHDRLLALDGSDQAGSRPSRQITNSERTSARPAGRPGGQRNHRGLLEGSAGGLEWLAGGPARAPVAGRPATADPGDGPSASVHTMAAWRVPPTRPSADGRPASSGGPGSSLPGGQADRDHRPYRKVADGLAISPRVSVVVPVMNEAANLPAVFATIPPWVEEVVLVDGRSTDNTIDVARQLRPDVKVVLQGGVGKGDALVAGFTASTGDIIVAIDGDGSTDGAEIVRFVSALMSGADFAKGSRFNSAGRSDDITAIRRLGNKLLNIMVNRLFKTSFSDLCYGYNAFWARHLGKLKLDSPGFEVETLMSIRAAEAGLRIYEVPSHERLRQHGVSNLSAIRDGWRILRLIAQEKRASRRRKGRKPRPFMAPGYLAQPEAGQDLPLRPAVSLDGHRAAHDGAVHGGATYDGAGHGGAAHDGAAHDAAAGRRRPYARIGGRYARIGGCRAPASGAGA
ncbi:MAG TPA: glycosyltransferase family 2 protein [Streptosporangiaceae bacterium]|nr:glycosyltransferase family 2 protein [Streptosporangiaceae bacterium]